MTPIRRLLVSVVLALCAVAVAGEEQWETIETGPIVVKNRKRPGTDVKEVWAEGNLDAGVLAIQTALTDISRYSRFMPCVTVAKQIGTAPDGGFFVYQRLDFPFFLSPRDLIHQGYIDRDARTDPQGAFANHWFAVPTKVPEQDGLIRLKTSEGSWLVTPLPNGRSHAVYRFAVDPGGMIPNFAANFGNSKGIKDTFAAVEAEAHRRAAEGLMPASTHSKTLSGSRD